MLPSNSICSNGLISYTRWLVERLTEAHAPLAEKYQSALSKFITFHGDGELPFSALTPELMLDFEAWMRPTVCRNTSSFYMRCLHAIYNRAMADGLAPQGCNPFRDVYTGVDKTRKRALQPRLIREIMSCDLTANRPMAYARDMFMMSFLLRGMSFVDMALLTRSNLSSGYLTYCRRKTRQMLTIKWLPEMQLIVGRYAPRCSSDYLLPIISATGHERMRAQYRSECRKVNRQLVRLGQELNLPLKLTTYVARHSWATAAQSARVPISVISRCLGHDSEQTTRIYLAAIDTTETDRANDAVVSLLR